MCYCGQPQTYQQCCQPIHENPKLALRPEQLMRARYSAHLTDNVDFIINTYHPSCYASGYRQSIIDTIALKWMRLEVIDSSDIELDEQQQPLVHEAFVEFKAYYLEHEYLSCLHENSRFLFQDQQWFYIDGVYPSSEAQVKKVHRNDLCPCLSGKKFKKCCY
ncbi:SEC-C domain-containing protein [Vibrio sp. SS-MA-C1-2]|uniref:YchJ family metal-binding protein n=1 Tax=Vibrio sp. SS-MA-C1-2 TaxID=2908646 RepID=UPI001F3F52C9|nr:YchJ family metal-binding protein [Vibrio sp. SS-MA-C1-2]UJF18674.1 SEC-C domain-containing protein [Vibrio sp. SS-MA-C1-2]